MQVTIAQINAKLEELNRLKGYPCKAYATQSEIEKLEKVHGTRVWSQYWPIGHGAPGHFVSNGTYQVEKSHTGYTLQTISMKNGSTGIVTIKQGSKREIFTELCRRIAYL